MFAANSPVTTIIVSVVALVLGIPVAIAALVYENVWVPNIILGSKTINTGPGQTTTLNFDLLTGPNDVVAAAAYISIVSSVLVVVGVVLIRHLTRHNVFGWLVFGPALLNLLGQIGCCAAAYIFQNNYPAATSTNEVQYIDGKYNTDGKLYTKEAWACTMKAFYANQETWADHACSNFKLGRILTIPLIVCATVILGVACWQVQGRGGFGWLFGRRDKVMTAYKRKEEYIDLQDN